jgi:hypothetical protein
MYTVLRYVLKSNLLPTICVRYVDDIFAIIYRRKLSPTLQMLNDQHSSIKSTVEEEDNGSLPLMDVRISKLGSSLEFAIYRKHTKMHIPASCPPIQHKPFIFKMLATII